MNVSYGIKQKQISLYYHVRISITAVVRITIDSPLQLAANPLSVTDESVVICTTTVLPEATTEL